MFVRGAVPGAMGWLSAGPSQLCVVFMLWEESQRWSGEIIETDTVSGLKSRELPINAL